MTRFPGRTALILLAGTALAGCVSPNFPIDAPAVPPPPQAAAPAPRPAPSEVAAAPLDPPPSAAPRVAEVESRPLAPIAAAPPAARAAEPPAVAVAQVDRPAQTRTVTTRSITGRVVDVEGEAQTYTVRRGDTLGAIADRMGSTVRELARDNDLRAPYNIRPGQVIKGPRQPAKAYVVGEGDTLFAIARRFGVSADAIAEANGMSLNDVIVVGRRLRLPDGFRDRGPIVSTAEVEVEPSSAAPPAAREAEGPPPEIVEGERRPVAPPRSAPPPPAEERTVTTRSVTGRVVDISVPGRAYKVKRGDNLERIARELDSSVSELARINNLRAPYRIQPGQTIRGPGSSAKAYVVERGDTLSVVAQRFGVTEAQLRSANGLRRGAALAPGRRLRLPAGYRDRGPIVTTTTAPVERQAPVETSPATAAPVRPTPPPPRSSPPPPRSVPPQEERLPSRPQPYTPPGGAVVGAPVATPPPSDAQISQMGRGRFTWPLQGETISGFGGRGTGPRNDGINLRARAGEPVRAAADGEVVYAGDQVPGFGNLVLIKHADGWVTAYGHLGRVDVRMQQAVSQGQQIGQAGSSGGVSEPQLHFEVRYAAGPQERARPVDPNLVMPR
jgi:murein DD-endopeptidase MepM/ murein hydrolase activator NlpD